MSLRIATYLIEYLAEFEFIFETVLGYVSGDQMGSFEAKKTKSKISCLGTFKAVHKAAEEKVDGASSRALSFSVGKKLKKMQMLGNPSLGRFSDGVKVCIGFYLAFLFSGSEASFYS
jgi:hypothetical protein